MGTAPKNDGLPATVTLPEGQRTEFAYPNLASPGARKAQFNLGIVTRKAAPVDPQPCAARQLMSA
ncbi:MAG: hypothetical protein JNK60_03295 [Acidobacteria bacterium]|nr:hypothetical protein [Acidobacteriota bacterium]